MPYTGCENQGSSFSNLPNPNYQLRSSDSGLSPGTPQWTFNSSSNTCTIQFDLPADLQHPVFIYYKLTNFFQNHRRYVQSLSTDQLKGKSVSFSTLSSSTCKPLATIGNRSIYPCGLISNSQFNGMCLPKTGIHFLPKFCQIRLTTQSFSTQVVILVPHHLHLTIFPQPVLHGLGRRRSMSLNPITTYQKLSLLQTG